MDEIINIADHYRGLVIGFASKSPFFVTSDVAESMEGLKHRLGRVARNYKRVAEDGVDHKLWLKLCDLMDYQVAYIDDVYSGVVTEKTTDLTPMRSFDYNFWKDVAKVRSVVADTSDKKGQPNKTHMDIVAISVVSSMRRGRQSRILSSSRSVLEVFNICEGTLLGCEGGLFDRQVEIYRMGVKGDFLTGRDIVVYGSADSKRRLSRGRRNRDHDNRSKVVTGGWKLSGSEVPKLTTNKDNENSRKKKEFSTTERSPRYDGGCGGGFSGPMIY